MAIYKSKHVGGLDTPPEQVLSETCLFGSA